MKFADIYRANLKSVKDTLTAMWCSEAGSDSQKAYAKQLKELINSKLFADESLYPVVQSMESYESTTGADFVSAMSLVGKDLWGKTKVGKKGFPPYVHQFKCWEALLQNNESIVVTTGTGSGKTECFMLPLVRDLLDNMNADGEHKIQAIFLYPLNALMEDQKARIQELLSGTPLHFAVYNGNLPERKDDDNANEIDAELNKYDRILPTRVQLHQTPPEILLTNPTMLEYMLLRDKDQKLFSKKSLRWIVVDEAHTFTGAGASELALLIRRVVNAFDVNPATDLRFAASSATIGNNADPALARFISDISGVPYNKVKVIGGQHLPIPAGLDPDVHACRVALQQQDFIRLDKLIPGPDSIVNKLETLDTLCDRGVRAKVHYFYRIPNNGIRVQLDNWADPQNGILRLLDRTPEQQDSTPALEFKRCKHCGEYIATAAMSSFDDTYKACADESGDVFSRMSPSQQHQLRIFGVVDKDTDIKGNTFVHIDKNHCTTEDNPTGQWCIAANDLFHCPHCGASLVDEETLADQESDGSSDDTDASVSDRELMVESLRVSSDFISQTLAPSLLSQLGISSASDPHKGQQYISFVDSRQAAAQSTFKQNLEVERSWVYSRVFHKLCEDQANLGALAAQLQNVKDRLRDLDIDDPNYDVLAQEMRDLRTKVQSSFAYLTWEDIYSYLANDCKGESDAICKQFVNKESDDEISGGAINDAVKERYVFSLMLEQLSKYPPHSASAETMGLLESYYPSLAKAITPVIFKRFNDHCGKPIADKDLDKEWKNLLKIYIDRVARSNEFIFMRLENHLDSDIFNCSNRFGLKKPSRRVARLPLVDKAEGRLPIIHILLAKMLGADSNSMRDVLKQNKTEINLVIQAMWHSLVDETQLLQYSSRIKSRNKNYTLGATKASDWVLDKDSSKNLEWIKEKYEGNQDIIDKILDPDGRQLRFNVAELAFRLPEAVHMCSVFEGKKEHIRPVTTLFCGHGAYYKGDDVCDPVETETWGCTYPYVKGLDPLTQVAVSEDEIVQWALANRSVLFRYGLLNEDGCFRNKIINCLSFPDIFLQAEHTAQVNKAVSKASQILFQNHKINILACSTTMEMGVDLGDLDLVMMSSIPPHPANYKQRAGRSGRNTGNRSACITLCSSDIVGLRVLTDPITTLIGRPVSMPTVDLDCPAIIQRHANAFLFRDSGKFFSKASGSNLHLEIIDCFSPYAFKRETIYTQTGKAVTVTNYWDLRDANGNEIFPNTSNPMGTEKGTTFESFRDWLVNNAQPSSLDFLIAGTSVQGKNSQIIAECLEEWEARREELIEELSQIGGDYEEAYTEVKRDPDSSKSVKALSNGQLDTPYGNKLRWEYYHILRKNLIEYLATHRFTPNANMPVDIVEFNVNSARMRNASPWKKQPNNPSYQLRQALSQYAPGNAVVKENRVLTVAGVDFIGKNRNDKDPLITFFTDGVDVVTSTMKSNLSSAPVKWPTSLKPELELVQAKAFIPDINEDDSRILGRSPYTHVNAQLVGAEKWSIPNGYTHLAAFRSSSHSGNAKILYYNDGIGFGYCLCGKCGKMVMESSAPGRLNNIPQEMVCEPLTLKDNTVLRGHYAIDRKTDDGKPKWCTPNNNKYFRNVILGDLIQTDYCEIKIRERSDANWIESRQDSFVPLLTTLGLLICKVYTEYVGKDRQSVDFLLMPTGSLCIFDTNPGGSGYSNKLADPHMFNSVISQIAVFLSTISSKDALLDRFTLRYINDIDIDRTRTWVEDEIASWKALPLSVSQSGINCKWATMSDIIKSLTASTARCTLFLNDDWDNWNYKIENQYYDIEEDTWKVRMELLRKESVRFSIPVDAVYVKEARGNLPAKLFDTAIEMKGWLNGDFKSAKNVLPAGLTPLAIVGNSLFITDDAVNLEASSQWGRGNIFVTDLSSVGPIDYEDVDLTHRPGKHAEFKLPMSNAFVADGKTFDLEKIRSNQLFDIVSVFSKLNGIDIAGFLKSMSASPERLELVYQDEHMKSGAGILVAMQFIESVITAAGKQDNFSLKFLNEEFYDYKGTDAYPFKGMNGHNLVNEVIELISEQMYNKLGGNTSICPFSIDTKGFNGLTHWRVLQIKCGNKQLSIYPNGGFVNEWMFDKQVPCTKTFDRNDNLDIDDDMPLFRRKEIKYEVIIDSE